MSDAGVLGSFAFDLLVLRQGSFFAIGMLLHHFLDERPHPSMLAALAVFAVASIAQTVTTVAGSGSPLAPVTVWVAGTFAMFESVKYVERAPQQRLATVARQAGLMTYPLYLNHFV